MGLSARHKRDRTARSRVCVRCQIMTIIKILKKFPVKGLAVTTNGPKGSRLRVGKVLFHRATKLKF